MRSNAKRHPNGFAGRNYISESLFVEWHSQIARDNV
jgi:hypothetical protein